MKSQHIKRLGVTICCFNFRHSKLNAGAVHTLESRCLLNEERSLIKHGMRGFNNNTAFTLIELLVVVLIIGILAAVALPQYQKAVYKSRMNSLLPLMRSIKDANELYFLNNNAYADDLSLLDVNVPPGDVYNHPEGGQMCYGNGTCFDNFYDYGKSGWLIVGGIGSEIYADDTCSIALYFDNSSKPGVVECGTLRSKHPKCAQICSGMGF